MALELHDTKTLAQYIDLVATYSTTDDELRHALSGDVSIIFYDTLADYQDIRDVFQDSNNVIILFPTTSRTVGHYIALLYYPDESIISLFDPYGYTLENDIKLALFLNTYDVRVKESLSRLLSETDLKVNVNRLEFQKRNNTSIRTCGKHCVARILFRDIIDHKEYYDFLKYRGLSRDDIVSLIFL